MIHNMLRSMQVLFEQKDVKLVYDVQGASLCLGK